MIRWAIRIMLSLAVLLLLALAGGWWLLPRLDLGSVAGRIGGTLLGRDLSFTGLKVVPGHWTRLEARGLRLAGLPGAAPMLEIAQAEGELDILSLFQGPPVLRHLSVSGARLRLERTPDGTGNWHFGAKPSVASSGGASGEVRTASPEAPRGAGRQAAPEARGNGPEALPPVDPSGRAGIPVLLDLALADGEVEIATSSGNRLHVRLDRVSLGAEDLDQPVRLGAQGAYNGLPLRLQADLASFLALRDTGEPCAVTLRVSSGDTSLGFGGTMVDPLNLDGAKGQLVLEAASPDVLLSIVGSPPAQPGQGPALRLAGMLERSGDHWRLRDATGSLGGAAITGGRLRLDEGARGQPDSLALDLPFGRLDLNRLLGGASSGRSGEADLSLEVDRSPDMLVSARLSAEQLDYGALRLTGARLAARLEPGRVVLEDLSGGYLGGKVEGEGTVENRAEPGGTGGTGGVISARLNASGLDVQALRRELGIGQIDLQGRMDGHVTLSAGGETLNGAMRAAHASAVVSMAGGSIARELIELASQDLRGLFRTARGQSAISCLLGVVDLRGGVATVAPFRLRAEHGTVAGNGRFDLGRRQMDLTFGSVGSTTGALALDIPVRVSGAFAAPAIRPARWTAEGRAMLAAGNVLGRIPPELRDFARRSPCLSG
ncbi:AsmA family protein [Roseomonas gilardii]|nr:AsmA-like C-terminal region-containing protein [Roseomonas gilardii]